MNPIPLTEAEGWARYWATTVGGPLTTLITEYDARGHEIDILTDQLHQLLDSQQAAIETVNHLNNTINKLDQPINSLKQIVAGDALERTDLADNP